MNDKNKSFILLEMAKKDFKALQNMLDPELTPIEIYGFHIQQALEKILKAWIDFLGLEYPLTHSISVLLSSLQQKGINVEPYWDLVEYNVFAVQYRYEAYDDQGEDIDRVAALERVKDLLEFVLKNIDR